MARSVSAESAEHGEDLLVGRDLPLLCADGVEPDDARAVDDEQCRTLSEAHRSARHVVGVEDRMVGIGKDRVRHRMFADISLDRCGGFRCDRNN